MSLCSFLLFYFVLQCSYSVGHFAMWTFSASVFLNHPLFWGGWYKFKSGKRQLAGKVTKQTSHFCVNDLTNEILVPSRFFAAFFSITFGAMRTAKVIKQHKCKVSGSQKSALKMVECKSRFLSSFMILNFWILLFCSDFLNFSIIIIKLLTLLLNYM